VADVYGPRLRPRHHAPDVFLALLDQIKAGRPVDKLCHNAGVGIVAALADNRRRQLDRTWRSN